MDRAVAAQGNRPILVQTSITSRMTQIAVDWQRQAVDRKAYDVLFIGKSEWVCHEIAVENYMLNNIFLKWSLPIVFAYSESKYTCT